MKIHIVRHDGCDNMHLSVHLTYKGAAESCDTYDT